MGKEDFRYLQKTPEYINALLVRETSNNNVKKEQGEYTAEDYYALPEEERVELIDGIFYVMEDPHSIHQALSFEILSKINTHIKKNKGQCVALLPVNTHLDADDRTIVGPDISVTCDRTKLINGRIYGAPDFIVEVLSPSTKKKDMQIKLKKYKNAGVREYWMVDPYEKIVIAYVFEVSEIPVIYGLDSEVPVAIFDGNCKIDFKEIYDYIQFLYD